LRLIIALRMKRALLQHDPGKVGTGFP